MLVYLKTSISEGLYGGLSGQEYFRLDFFYRECFSHKVTLEKTRLMGMDLPRCQGDLLYPPGIERPVCKCHNRTLHFLFKDDQPTFFLLRKAGAGETFASSQVHIIFINRKCVMWRPGWLIWTSVLTFIKYGWQKNCPGQSITAKPIRTIKDLLHQYKSYPGPNVNDSYVGHLLIRWIVFSQTYAEHRLSLFLNILAIKVLKCKILRCVFLRKKKSRYCIPNWIVIFAIHISAPNFLTSYINQGDSHIIETRGL